MNSTSDALMTLDEYKQSLLTSIHIGITATNNDDAYSVGLRNGLRICKAYIDGQEPEYEEVKNDPLTWDELKAMEGKPVWVEADSGIASWWLVDRFFDLENDILIGFVSRYGYIERSKNLQDVVWQAYRKERC